MLKKIALGLCILFLIPPLLVLALRWLPPPTTAYMLQSPVKPVHHQWVPAEQIAESARRAVIAAEDQKFRDHSGFDLEAMQKAYERNQRSRRIRGGSTISQQTAKNLFLWPGGGYFRKGIEATFTLLIEGLWGKERILEVYLNIAEFGPGLYGVEAAAQEFFGKHAAQLTAAEAARLAAVLPNPRRWNVRRPGPYVQKRTAWILGQLGYRNPATPAQEPVEPVAEAAPAEATEPPAEAAETPEAPVSAEPVSVSGPAAQNLPAPPEPESAEAPSPADAPAAAPEPDPDP